MPRAVRWSRCERSGFHLSVSRVGAGAVFLLFLKGARQENVVKGGLCLRVRVERAGTGRDWTVIKIK